MSFPKRLLYALNYNEKKVQKGAARCIGAGGYLLEPEALNFYQKLQGLERRNVLNDRATTKTLHVSLNFDPSERLPDETLVRIASEYMERIGFGKQPFLVYKHLDAGHPHLHIVSTTIREDGSRIPTHNLGKNQSEKARKELEVAFGLVRAEGQKRSVDTFIKPVLPLPVTYGLAETRRSITGVVRTVFDTYVFTSLAEYNAALRQFNVLADRGREEGRIYRQQGLVYRILDEKGQKVGVPIKASILAGKPTLENLSLRFAVNENRKVAHKPSLVEKIDACLGASPSSLNDLMEALGKKDVFTLPRRNAEGWLYGITFVDNQSRCVFNGSDLGRGYSASTIQGRLASTLLQNKTLPMEKMEQEQVYGTTVQQKTIPVKEGLNQQARESLPDLLLAPKPYWENATPELLKKKKRRKKKSYGI